MDADHPLSRARGAALIFHVTTEEDVRLARADGEVRTASLHSEGFVHCCTADQLPGVLDRFWAGRAGLLVLHLDAGALGPALRWEAPAHPDGSPATDAEAGQRFPHVHGPIPLGAVVAVEPLEPRPPPAS